MLIIIIAQNKSITLKHKTNSTVALLKQFKLNSIKELKLNSIIAQIALLYEYRN